MDNNENNLINKIIEGDKEAFRQIVNNYQDMVYHLALVYLKNEQEAEDLTQEVFISVYENIHSFRKESNLKTWIYRITINKSINQLRKMKWKNNLTNIEKIGTIVTAAFIVKENPQSKIEETESQNEINKALLRLPSNQKTAFVLNKFEELSYKEIADIMKISLPAVESLIHRAKINLQKYLCSIKNF